MTTAWGRLSFSVVLIILAAVTLAGVAVLRVEGAGVYSLTFLAVPLAAGGWYLYENRDHPPLDLSAKPAPPPAPATPAPGSPGGAAASGGPGPGGAVSEPWEPMPSPDEPFDDPVELADQLDREAPVPSPAPEPSTEPSNP